MASNARILDTAKSLIDFVDKSPSPYHVVDVCKKALQNAGFQEISEKQTWNIEKNKSYFLTKNQSTVIAFAVGGAYEPGNGFHIIGAHTDSPCLKVKPVSKKVKSGCLQVGVECYGGGIWQTWFDRDLTVAGRVIIKGKNGLEHKLVNIEKPILRVPHLAIHLQREMNTNFKMNTETNLLPILATAAMEKVNKGNENSEGSETDDADRHSHVLMKLIADKVGCDVKDIVDFDLCLADTQPAAIGGALDEFIFAPRLDNLFNAYCALEGIIAAAKETSISSSKGIQMIVLFDNEEVGSQSAQGAGSKLTDLVLQRIASSISGLSSSYEQSIAHSFLLSADQAHAVHPNYSEKHEDNHKPQFHKGPVLKFNANQRYATTAITSSILRIIAEKSNVPLQNVCVRNDSSCGSTIGPILSSKLGIRTIDLGGPMLSMHSIREMCCTSGVSQTIDLFKGFFKYFTDVDSSFNVE